MLKWWKSKLVETPVLPPQHAFRPRAIRFDDMIFLFKHELPCDVDHNPQGVVIRYAPLKLEAWGQTFSEAETAFSFQVFTHYHKYCMRPADALPPQGLLFRATIKEMLQQVLLEAPRQDHQPKIHHQ